MSASPDIYLFRHGLAENNLQPHLVFGQGDGVNLTEQGYLEAGQLGHELQRKGLIPDVVYSSTALRARQTAETALGAMGLKVPIIEDARLQEQHTGEWTGRVAKEVFTDETIAQTKIMGKDFSAPKGESMNMVSKRMISWLLDVESRAEDTGDEIVFGFTHTGAIRCLASYLHNWDHPRTYQTQLDNVSMSRFRKKNGLWQLDLLGVEPAVIPAELDVATEINTRLATNELVAKHLESVIWFGSVRNRQDVHSRSDSDIQIILDQPDIELTVELNKILQIYPDVDLSIMYLKDIFDDQGNVIFHDGTKGVFFTHVLAAGKVLYGRNVYADIVENLSLEDIRPSLMLTAREYLSRLRVMAAQSPDDTLAFKKYSMKLFKDLLLYEGAIEPKEMTRVDNAMLYKAILQKRLLQPARAALTKVIDYEHVFTGHEMAVLLQEYEDMVGRLCNE